MKKVLLLLCLLLTVPAAFTATIYPMTDAELYRRADVIVLGTVLSNQVRENEEGWPETVTMIEPIKVVKGSVSQNFALHQVGGQLPDGRGFMLYGRPEYRVGRQVLVFANARPDGRYQTTELMLGKFEIHKDLREQRFAIPDFESGARDGVLIIGEVSDASVVGSRDLNRFIDYLRRGATGREDVRVMPVGPLTPVQSAAGPLDIQPSWSHLDGTPLVRWPDFTTPKLWWFNGSATQIAGGSDGRREAAQGMATLRNDDRTTIRYAAGPNGPPAPDGNPINLNFNGANGCWGSGCWAGSGVIGCGGPWFSGATHPHRSQTYNNIVAGETWLRCIDPSSEISSSVAQSILTHEHGHTLGLGHSSGQAQSLNDLCVGDEAQATMFPSAPDRITLGTDDVDAIRWIYSTDTVFTCDYQVASITPTFGAASGGVSVTATGTATNWSVGSTGTLGGIPIVPSVSSATSLSFVTPPLTPGSLNTLTITTAGQNATLPNAYFADFLDVPGSHPFHNFVEKMVRHNITVGCGGGNYCPSDPVTRGQMAVFLLIGRHGTGYTPPACTVPMFADVPSSSPFCPYIEQLAREGITAGCGGGNYCPNSPITRQQMAVFLVTGKYGTGYTPPACTVPMFGDVPASSSFCRFVEQLAREGITAGCGGGNFCPTASTTRGQMAVFLGATFGL